MVKMPRKSPPASRASIESAELAAAHLRRAKDRGTELLAAGELEAALAAFREVVKAAPDELSYRQKVAEVLQRLGRTQEAIAEYEAAAEAWARTGWLLRAIALCKVILQLDPKHTRTQALLARLHAKQVAPQGAPSGKAPVAARTAGQAKARTSEAAPPDEAIPPIPLFSALGREVFLEVLWGVERSVVQAGEVIVREGAPGNSMFVIVEGEVSVTRQDKDGQPVTVAKLGEGGFFGEMAMLHAGPRLASVVAETRTVLLEFTRERMEEISTRYPQVAEVVRRLHRGRLLANVLRSNKLFASWPEELKNMVAEAFVPVSVKKGEEILSRGQPAQALYILLRGRCSVFHQHVNGRETAYPDMVEGDVFGEVSLLRSKLVTASVRAATPCVLLKLERASLEPILERYPKLREELKLLGSRRLQRTSQLLAGKPAQPGASYI